MALIQDALEGKEDIDTRSFQMSSGRPSFTKSMPSMAGSQTTTAPMDSQSFTSFNERFQEQEPVGGDGSSLDVEDPDVKESKLAKTSAFLEGAEFSKDVAIGVAQFASERRRDREAHQRALDQIFKDKAEFDRQKRLALRQRDIQKIQDEGALLLDNMIRDIEKNKAQKSRVLNSVNSLNERINQDRNFKDMIRQFSSQRQV